MEFPDWVQVKGKKSYSEGIYNNSEGYHSINPKQARGADSAPPPLPPGFPK